MSRLRTASRMLTLHHLNNSRSQRILWLLEELEVPYEIKKYQRRPNQTADPALKQLTKLGKAPIIQDSDGDVVLAESGAIIEYIINKYANGRFDATSDSGKIDDLYYTHYAEGSLMPLVALKHIGNLAPRESPFFIRPLVGAVFAGLNKAFIGPELKTQVDMVEEHLSTKSWFAGGDNPTKADYMMSFPCEAIAQLGVAGPKTVEWVKKVQSRPAYLRGLEKGGEYDYKL